MPATSSEPAKLTDTVTSEPETGSQASTMQSDGQKSPSSVLPSSQVSGATMSPLPQPLTLQLLSQPSPFAVLPSSHSSSGVTVPFPQSVQKFEQPSVGSVLPSSHSSLPSCTSLGKPPAQVTGLPRHAASAAPPLHTSFAPEPPAIDLYAQFWATAQWQFSSPPLVTQ